ncbi:hypothetical protein D6745_01170 [Candidatus Woesearchaeota archaeon]|nr:MAG: hypothetical protein D6745_01170 [Candidatus Woesearchaeota archaeon]
MSTSSRAFNIAWSAYSAVSLIGRAFGMDIDPTPGNAATLLGLGVAADTAVREVCYGLHYYMNHPNSTYSDPWGEPILSLIDANRHPEWYH